MTEQEREEMIMWIGINTHYSIEMLEKMTDEELKKEYEDRVVNKGML